MELNKKEIKFLEKKISKSADSPLFARLADRYLEQGDVDKAIGICEEGLQEYPYYVTGHIILAKCYAALGMNDQAKSELKRVLLFDPQCVSATKMMGDIMKEEGWENLYEESYRRLASLDPLEESIAKLVEGFGARSKLQAEAESSPMDAVESGAPDSEKSERQEETIETTSAEEAIEEIVQPEPKADEMSSDIARTLEMGSPSGTSFPNRPEVSDQNNETFAETDKTEPFTETPLAMKEDEELPPISFAQPEPLSDKLPSDDSSTELTAEAPVLSGPQIDLEDEDRSEEPEIPAPSQEYKDEPEAQENQVAIPEDELIRIQQIEEAGDTSIASAGEALTEESLPAGLEEQELTGEVKEGAAAQQEDWGAWETVDNKSAESVETDKAAQNADQSLEEHHPEPEPFAMETGEQPQLPVEEEPEEEKFIEVPEILEDINEQISPEKAKELDWILNEGEEVPQIIEEDITAEHEPPVERMPETEAELENVPSEKPETDEAIPDIGELSSLEEEEILQSPDMAQTEEATDILHDIEAKDLPPGEEQNLMLGEAITDFQDLSQKDLPSIQPESGADSEEFLLDDPIPGMGMPDKSMAGSEEALLPMPDRDFYGTVEEKPELPGAPEGELLSLIDEVIGDKGDQESEKNITSDAKFEELEDLPAGDLLAETPSDEIELPESRSGIQDEDEIPPSREFILREEEDLKTGVETDSRIPEEFSLKEFDKSPKDRNRTLGTERLLRIPLESGEMSETPELEEQGSEPAGASEVDLRDMDEILEESDRKKRGDKDVLTGMRKFGARENIDNDRKAERDNRNQAEASGEEFPLLPGLPLHGEISGDDQFDETGEMPGLSDGGGDIPRRTPKELKTGYKFDSREPAEPDEMESSPLRHREKVDKSGSGLEELATLTLGEIYLSTNQLSKAIDVFKQLKERYPDNKKIYAKLRRAQRLKRNAQKGQKNPNESPDPETYPGE